MQKIGYKDNTFSIKKFTFYISIKPKSSNISFNPKFFDSEKKFEKKQLIQKTISIIRKVQMSHKTPATRIQNNNKALKQSFNIIAERIRPP